jgi:hypothetical protein
LLERQGYTVVDAEQLRPEQQQRTVHTHRLEQDMRPAWMPRIDDRVEVHEVGRGWQQSTKRERYELLHESGVDGLVRFGVANAGDPTRNTTRWSRARGIARRHTAITWSSMVPNSTI